MYQIGFIFIFSVERSLNLQLHNRTHLDAAKRNKFARNEVVD
jgi:hypothetical protein